MTVLPFLPSLASHAVWTPEQAGRARLRMLKPWHRFLAHCHGVWALKLDNSPVPLAASPDPGFPLETLRMACVWHFGHAFRASGESWPVQPASLDLVVWRLSAPDLAILPALIGQMNLALGPAARVLICVEAPLLNTWCQVGMPLCRGHDWVLREAEWGDGRVLTWLPSRWSSKWSSAAQVWLPRAAQWSVQLWQRETVCPTPSGAGKRTGKRVAAGLSWQPQSTLDHPN